MLLVIMNLLRLQHIPVQQLLQLDKGARLVAADVPQVIRTATADGKGLGVLEFLDIYLIIGSVAVVLDPESDRFKQLIIFDQFDISNGMDLLSPANHFIGPIGIHILDKVR
jgi:hypothetical protein